MCGINGLLDYTESIDADRFEKATDLMTRRGPDGSGFFFSKNVALGHRRLRVIDLSTAADQPFFNPEKTVGIVFNGEIFNFKTLRQELETLGHQFQTRADTEVLLNSWLEWGENCLKKLNGMFAFGVLDLRNGKEDLWIARDRTGIKPLFYAHQGKRFAFASELKPLLKVSWISKNISPETLFLFLKHSHVPNPLSIFSDIQQVKPGEWVKFTKDTLHRGNFFELSSYAKNEPAQIQSFQDTLNETEKTLKEVVERQLVSDVPLGAFLSGGIDSSLLVWASVASGAKDFHTFSIGYKESKYDETPHAQSVADHFKTTHHTLIAEPKDFFSLISDLPVFFDQPFADPTAPATLLLAKFAREHVTVALSGDGGDELFFGYPYEHFLYETRFLKHLPRGGRNAFANTLNALSKFAPASRRPALKKMSDILKFRSLPEFFQYFIGTIGPLEIPKLANLLQTPPDVSRSFYGPMIESFQGLPWEQMIEQVFLHTFLPDTVLQKTDRAGMAWGLEARVPFLDDQMLELASRIPFRFKYRQRTGKFLLRELLKQKLPGNLFDRKKQGFSIPMAEWLRGDLSWLLKEFLDSKRLAKEEYFNPLEVEALVKSHQSGRMNHSHLLWSLINFQIWKEKYL